VTKTRAIPFVVLFQGRTGSTFLVEALDSHPQVRADYERLASDKWAKKGAAAQLDAARESLAAPPGSPWRAVGFKTKLGDVLDPPGLAALLAEEDARVIHLKRRNLVKLTVSSFNSQRVHERTGDWNLYSRDAAASEPLTIEPEWFSARLRRVVEHDEALDRYVAAAARPTLTLFYEDLLLDTQASVDRAFSFLGVEPIPARGMTVKATADDLRAALANFEELRAGFAGTPFEAMFDEVLVAADGAAQR
jgi:LPS sulfotransferase NodH